jgi:hypothetical protein
LRPDHAERKVRFNCSCHEFGKVFLGGANIGKLGKGAHF